MSYSLLTKIVSQSARFRFLIVLCFLGDAAAPKKQQVLTAGSCYDSVFPRGPGEIRQYPSTTFRQHLQLHYSSVSYSDTSV